MTCLELIIFLMLLWAQEIASKIDKLDHEIYLNSKYLFKRRLEMCKTDFIDNLIIS